MEFDILKKNLEKSWIMENHEILRKKKLKGCSKQITLLCKFLFGWKISCINKGCEFVADTFTK